MPSSVVEARYNLNIIVVEFEYADYQDFNERLMGQKKNEERKRNSVDSS